MKRNHEALGENHRDLVRIASDKGIPQGSRLRQEPEDEETKGFTVYPGYKYDGYAWGMSIDLNRCVGCNACVIACQSENNIAVVGKDQVERGRAMHWIRIDTFPRHLDNPHMYYEPLPCMQSENAPCQVCLPGRRYHAQCRGPERHDVQPLRRHAVLLEQLPL